MQVIVRDRTFLEETSTDNLRRYFPYVETYLEGAAVIRDVESDLERISNFGRQLMKSSSGNIYRMGWMPMHVLDEAWQNGINILDRTFLETWFKENPGWSARKRR